MASVTMFDETAAGERGEALVVEFLRERVTVRELIRSRVYQEVTEHNARLKLDGQAEGKPRRRFGRWTEPVDWQAEYEKALAAFAGNGFLLFAGDRQLMDLDEEVELTPGIEVSFLRLVPLVGG